MALADLLPDLKKRVIEEKKKLREKGFSAEDIPSQLVHLEREFQDKLWQ